MTQTIFLLDPDGRVRVRQILDDKYNIFEYDWILTDESWFRKDLMTNAIFVNMTVQYF